MVKPIPLHPKIRVRKDARVSASALADYIIAAPDRQDNVLHDARYMKVMPVSHYADALRSIKSYCLDPYRDLKKLENMVAVLGEKSQSAAFTPSQREDAKRCIETIDRFEIAANAFAATSMMFLEPSTFGPLEINGVTVSVQPDLLVRSKDKTGLVFIRPQKHPNPEECKTSSTRVERQEYRRELARYMLTLGWMLLKKAGYDDELIDTRKMFVWDLRMQEAIPFPTDRVSRIKRINAACKQIYHLWAHVEPKSWDYQKKY